MAEKWSLREYEVFCELVRAGVPIGDVPMPTNWPRFELRTRLEMASEIIDLGPVQTGYVLPLLAAYNICGEFAVEQVELDLPWGTIPVDWYKNPSDWKGIPEFENLRLGYRQLNEGDLSKLPYRMRRGQVIRSVLVGVSEHPIPEEFLGAGSVPATVIFKNYWGREYAGTILLTISRSKRIRLNRPAVQGSAEGKEAAPGKRKPAAGVLTTA
jgi:hypothetical protein